MGGLSVLCSVAGGIVFGGVVVIYLLKRKISSKWGSYSSHSESMEGKVVVVTGANTGLGFDASVKLARKRVTLIMACRDSNRGVNAVNRVIAASGHSDVHFMKLDLASLESVKEFALEFHSRFEHLHILVCNAGVWMPMNNKMKTKDGFEIHFGVNHLGHHLLINLLRDKIIASLGRVVLVSSLLMMRGELDMESKVFIEEGRTPIKESHFPTGYSDSKLMNALMAKQYAASGLTSIALCPGLCDTELGRYVKMPFWKRWIFYCVTCFIMRSSEKGSETLIHGALDENIVNGGFYRECQIATKETEKLDGLFDVGKELHKLSDDLIKQKS